MNRTSVRTGKLDLKKELKPLYSGKAGIIQVVMPGSHRYLCCQGAGDPNTSSEYKAAVEALFSLSYTLKFALRKERQVDYAVMPLEGVWWSDRMESFVLGDRSQWKWTMMILQPPFVNQDHLARAKETVARKGVAMTERVTLDDFDEGKSAQVLHVGPFAEEGPSIARLHDWISQQQGRLTGKHHEIYLSDIRRTPPSRWKTLLRQPFGTSA